MHEQLVHQRGHVKRICRRGGDSFLYRLTLDGNYFSVNFAAGTPEDLLATFLTQVDSLIWEFRYRRSFGEAAMTWNEFQGRVMEIRARLLGVDLKVEVVRQTRDDGKTLGDLRAWYEKIVKSEKLAEITVRYRLDALDRLIGFLGAKTRLCDVTRHRLDDFKRDLLKTNDAGAYWLLQKLQSVFKTASYENFIGHYPFLGFKYPRRSRAKEFLILTLEEMWQVRTLITSQQTALAWDISCRTGIRGNDLLMLEYRDFDFKRKIIRYKNHKLARFEGVIMHPSLIAILSALPAAPGRVFSYKNEQSLSALFRTKVRECFGERVAGKSIGTHTPRRSLAHYLRHVARWPKEDIRIFLGHHDQDVTDGYLMESLETIRDKWNALPFS